LLVDGPFAYLKGSQGEQYITAVAAARVSWACRRRAGRFRVPAAGLRMRPGSSPGWRAGLDVPPINYRQRRE